MNIAYVGEAPKGCWSSDRCDRVDVEGMSMSGVVECGRRSGAGGVAGWIDETGGKQVSRTERTSGEA